KRKQPAVDAYRQAVEGGQGGVVEIDRARLAVLGSGERRGVAEPIDRPAGEAQDFAAAATGVEADQDERGQVRRAGLVTGDEKTLELVLIQEANATRRLFKRLQLIERVSREVAIA